MLGKLIKYDMKTLSRLLILIHVPIIVLAVIARYLGIERIYSGRIDLLAVLILVLCIIYWSFISLFTQAYIAVYTYRNLFTQEGYLTMTLPVKSGTQVLAKFLSGSLWILIDCLILYASLFIVFSVPELWADIQKTVPEVLDIFRIGGQNSLGSSIYLLTLLNAFGNMAFILGSLTFGHCFSRHRILTAILGYFGLTLIQQLIAGGMAAGISFRNVQYHNIHGKELPFDVVLGMYHSMFLIIFAIFIIMGILCLFFSQYVLKKRLNLD